MVNSDKGITNLHVPSDVIVDASMPAMIRTSGQMWNARGQAAGHPRVLPDSSYAGVYEVVFDDCKKHGAFDPATMGSVPNVGLMAQKAEEYGSHDKTFEIKAEGTVRVVDDRRHHVLEHAVERGRHLARLPGEGRPVRDWVKLAVRRARATGTPAVFWLDARAHDAQVIAKVKPTWPTTTPRASTSNPVAGRGHALHPRAPARGRGHHLGHRQRAARLPDRPVPHPRAGHQRQDAVHRAADERRRPVRDRAPAARRPSTCSSSRRRTTCAGTLGEFLALAVSFEHLSQVTHGNPRAKVLADTWTGPPASTCLDENKSPGRKVGQLDNRGSHFYLALYWAEALGRAEPPTPSSASPWA
jgi:isocitrate dehydrogenase